MMDCMLENIIVYCIYFSKNIYYLFCTNICSSHRQTVQKEREEKLIVILKDRLNPYVQGNKEEFVAHAEAEVVRLSNAGNHLLLHLSQIVYLYFVARHVKIWKILLLLLDCKILHLQITQLLFRRYQLSTNIHC